MTQKFFTITLETGEYSDFSYTPVGLVVGTRDDAERKVKELQDKLAAGVASYRAAIKDVDRRWKANEIECPPDVRPYVTCGGLGLALWYGALPLTEPQKGDALKRVSEWLEKSPDSWMAFRDKPLWEGTYVAHEIETL